MTPDERQKSVEERKKHWIKELKLDARPIPRYLKPTDISRINQEKLKAAFRRLKWETWLGYGDGEIAAKRCIGGADDALALMQLYKVYVKDSKDPALVSSYATNLYKEGDEPTYIGIDLAMYDAIMPKTSKPGKVR